jgi:hypothetical protein
MFSDCNNMIVLKIVSIFQCAVISILFWMGNMLWFRVIYFQIFQISDRPKWTVHQTFVDWWLSWIDCIGMMYVDQIQSDIVLYFFVIPKPNELVGTRMPLLVHNHIIPIGLKVLWLHISSSSTTRDFGHEESLVWQIGRLCLPLVGKESQWCKGDLPTCFLRRAYAFTEVFFLFDMLSYLHFTGLV